MTMQHRIAPLIFALFLLVSVGTASPALAQGGGGSPPAAPDDGGPRTWQIVKNVNLREQPSTRSDVLTKYKAGELLSNLGCRSAEGRAWCDVQKIRGGKRGFVAAEFINPPLVPMALPPRVPMTLPRARDRASSTPQVECRARQHQASRWASVNLVSRALVAVTQQSW
jgi:hypothetical protein